MISKATAKRDEVYKFEIYEAEKVLCYILVYPDDLKAKLYKLEGSKYDKQGDFIKETYRFEFDGCSFEIDFAQVFVRFRKQR